MINVVALFLVVTSLVSAGVWSPTAPKSVHEDRDMIVRDGHRVVVVEFDPEKPVTKVSISPESDVFPRRGVNSDVNAMLEGEGISNHHEDYDTGEHHRRSPKELICDAYGKCKHKISDAIGRTKETVEEAVSEAKNATAHADETLCEATQEAAHEVAEKAKDAVHRTEEDFDRAKGSVERGASEAYKRARSGARHLKDAARGAAKDVTDLGKTMGTDVVKNVTGWAAEFPAEAATWLPRPVSGVAHFVAFSTAFGTGVWVTFVLSYVLGRALPRQQFGMVQSRIYPVYFRVMAAGIGTALLGFVAGHERKVVSHSPERFQALNLLASLGVVLVNMLFLEPRATKVMLEKMRAEKEEGRGEGAQTAERPETRGATAEQEAARNRVNSLSGRLKTLNTLSSTLNVLSLMALSCHVYYLGNSLLDSTTHD